MKGLVVFLALACIVVLCPTATAATKTHPLGVDGGLSFPRQVPPGLTNDIFKV